MKSNTRGRIQEGTTVELETLIEGGSGQEINCEQWKGKRERGRKGERGRVEYDSATLGLVKHFQTW